MDTDDAALLSDSLVAADLRGIHSHGVLRAPEYVGKLLGGGVDPKGRPRVVRDSAAALVVDGGNSMGQIGAHFAMRQAIVRARTTNVAAAAVRGSNHCGALSYYAMQALEENMIGIAMTNALPTMAPWGGLDKVVGINPLAIAVPADECHPLVFDAAFSYSSHGKIRVYQQKGEAIPSAWAFDKEGHPTTDAAKALEGLLQPIGEYKGVGLAILFGVLSSLLSGAAYGDGLGNMVEGAKPGLDGHLIMAIRIAGFEDPARFKSRVDGVIRQIETGRARQGIEKLFAPGGVEAQIEQEHTARGIPLTEDTLEGLNQAALRTQVDRRIRDGLW